VAADCAIAANGFRQAGERGKAGEARDLEAAAYQLVRCYNALDRAGLRIARAFENQIESDSGWHAEVMRRLCLNLPGVRPEVFEQSDLAPLNELRGFRHVIVHAYDLVLNCDRIHGLLGRAAGFFDGLEQRYERFFNSVAQGLKEER
jgi:hypothetical protein